MKLMFLLAESGMKNYACFIKTLKTVVYDGGNRNGWIAALECDLVDKINHLWRWSPDSGNFIF